MKRILLFALMLSGLITSAQTSITSGNCKAQYKYAVNDKVMTLVPATAINFYDRSEGKVTAWYWDFGDGITSREQNPMFVFNHPTPSTTAKYSPYRSVSLTILTSDTCKSFYSEMINIMDGTPYIKPDCTARFKYYQAAYDTVHGTATFQLTNLSEGDSLKYFWKFDNGKTSTEKEPTVTFDIKPAEHQACLTVTGKNNSSDTFCDVIYFSDPNKPIIYPAECYTGFGYSVNYKIQTFAPALVLDFYSKATPDAAEWNWNFDDGTTSNEANPTHIFNFPVVKDSILGDPNPFRKVCLTVKTASGCVASYCETINIYMNSTPPVEPAQPCHAWFKYYRPTDVISIPEVIPYKLIDASEGKVVSQLWQFENGTTSTEVEPLVNFDFLKPSQKVCLTIYTADSCSSTWCETIYVSEIKPDTSSVPKPASIYTMRYESGFPIQMSSCAGWAKAQVYMNDTLVNATNYSWSTGEQGQEVKGLCPTRIYSVKAISPDGTIVSGMFVFNSDGTVTVNPINWWVTGGIANPVIQYKLANDNYTVEWQVCDGTFVRSDSIPLNSMNCGTKESVLILKDASGNVVYTENISLKTLATFLNPEKQIQSVKLFPNPVNDVLNIQYSGKMLDEMQIEIWDIAGKSVSKQKIYQVESGQNISLNMNSLKKGIYLCKMISGKQLIGIGKFMK
ncbi:MAG: T9SS type A sorting domain-containing protein [Bacteroidota bacterium]|nr:T9SS type A sorting domain-containing protein [Bacteroidota bacterium]